MATKTKKQKKSKKKAKAPKPDPVVKEGSVLDVSFAQAEAGKMYRVLRVINKRCFMAKAKGSRVFEVFCWVRPTEQWTWAIVNRNNPHILEPVLIEKA